jgi:hypothetical protein
MLEAEVPIAVNIDATPSHYMGDNEVAEGSNIF